MQDDEAFVIMSKYDSLWEYIGKCGKHDITLTYEEIEKICGVPRVEKISMKNRTVRFTENE